MRYQTLVSLVVVAGASVADFVTAASAKPPSWDTVKPGASRFKILKASRYLASAGLLFALAAVLTAQSIAGEPIEWPIANGGNGHFYQFVEDAVPWTSARNQASAASYEGLPGHLVTISNAEENTFVASLAWPESAWIGLTDQTAEAAFQWVTGELLTFTNWAQGEPNSLGDEDCVETNAYFARGTPGTWNDISCSTGRFYVLEFETSAECVTPPAGMIAWWPGDGDAADIQGGNNGVLLGDATFATGKVGQAFKLDGDGDSLEVSDSPAWAFGADNFTIDLWAQFSSADCGALDNPRCVFVAQDEGGGAQNKWVFGLGPLSQFGGSQNVLFFHINADGPPSQGGAFLAKSGFQPNVGQWYHFAVKRDGTDFTILVDGTPVSVESSTMVVPDADAPLKVGHAEAALTFPGLIDEVEIFDRALSANEVQAIFHAGAAGKCKDNAECLSDAGCDDGDPCNGDETCDANGQCEPGTPPLDGCPTTPTPTPTATPSPTPTLPAVLTALGDSYSAGDGAPGEEKACIPPDEEPHGYDCGTHVADAGRENHCHRSALAYPRVFAQQEGYDERLGVSHYACSGAETKHILEKLKWDSELVPQIRAVSARSDLVTITIGGNDVGFADIAWNCFFKAKCKSHYARSATNDKVSKKIQGLVPKLFEVYSALADEVPADARIAVLGYPLFVAEPSDLYPGIPCAQPGLNYLQVDDARWIRAKIVELNEAIRYAVGEVVRTSGRTNLLYVDVTNAFHFHEVCQLVPWVTTAGLARGSSVNVHLHPPFHPNYLGHQEIAKCLANALNGGPPCDQEPPL
jgi:lysophospholipase L1-like esterase